jgi:predicted nuclease of predicted toxin-antitoxin system
MAEGLKKAGYDAIHVRELGMASAPDHKIMDYAISRTGTKVHDG